MPEYKNIYRDSTMRICVDKTERRGISGKIYSSCLSWPRSFSDFGKMILLVEEILDQQDFPKAFQRKRSFSASGAAEKKEEPQGSFLTAESIAKARGTYGTFEIRVFSRQNATWQGEIDWLDESPPQVFLSALELIHLVSEREKSYGTKLD